MLHDIERKKPSTRVNKDLK